MQPRFYADATAGVRSNILDVTTLSRIVELTWIILVQIANGLPFHVCRARWPGACALTAGHGGAATRPVHRTGRPAPRPRTIHATIPITDSSVSDEIDVRVAGPARQIAVEKITPTGSCPFLGRYAFHGVGPKEKTPGPSCASGSARRRRWHQPRSRGPSWPGPRLGRGARRRRSAAPRRAP